MVITMRNNHRFYLKYVIDGKNKETDELLSRPEAELEKKELEADGATNVRIVKYTHLVFQS
jgi:hypothetical protein